MYQPTPEGENAERALADFDRRFGAAGALQSAALDDRVVQLRSLAELRHPNAAREDRNAERWAAVGVSLDTLASSLLVQALRFDRSEPVGAALDGLVGTAQPVLVTLRMLLAGARPLADEVFVCEDPAVLVAAADRFGAACAPIVCVRGQPSVAVPARGARGLRRGAALPRRLRLGGIRIADAVMQRFGAAPWRFGAEDLRVASVPGDALVGDRVEAVWDPALADAVASRGAAPGGGAGARVAPRRSRPLSARSTVA